MRLAWIVSGAGGFVTSVGGGSRALSYAARRATVRAFVIAFTVLFAAAVCAQEGAGDATLGASNSKLEVSKSILDFAQPGQRSPLGSASEKKSFTIKDN